MYTPMDYELNKLHRDRREQEAERYRLLQSLKPKQVPYIGRAKILYIHLVARLRLLLPSDSQHSHSPNQPMATAN